MAIKDTKTKMDDTSYVKQFYMPPISPCPDKWTQSSLLLALRTRTVRGIRSDFGDMFPTKQWPLDQSTRKIPNAPTPPFYNNLLPLPPGPPSHLSFMRLPPTPPSCATLLHPSPQGWLRVKKQDQKTCS